MMIPLKLFRTQTLLSNHLKKFVLQQTGLRFKKTQQTSYVVEPTTMKIQKFDPTLQDMKSIPLFVSKYSTNGFTIQGNKLYGSVAILPKSYYSWKVKKAEDINIESLQLFTVYEPKVEILVIGTGEKLIQLPQDVRQYLRQHNISLEVLDTPNALSTYNFLVEEDRITGAVLIPPEHIPL